MARCQHCNKMTHSEHLNVYYDIKDQDKILELTYEKSWVSKYMYSIDGIYNPEEYGKLKVGDIVIHFISRDKKEIND